MSVSTSKERTEAVSTRSADALVPAGTFDELAGILAQRFAGLGQGITVSAVGVDVHGSAAFMANMSVIAQEGNGRYYQSESAAQIPDIFLDETRTGLQPWIVHVGSGDSLVRFRRSASARPPSAWPRARRSHTRR